MASFTYGLINLLVGKLDAIINEKEAESTPLVLNFRDNFEWLRKNLIRIRGYLRDADARSAHDASLKSWLEGVEEIAWDAEDILEEFSIESKAPADIESAQSSCLCTFGYSKLGSRYKITRRIKDLNDRIAYTVNDAVRRNLTQGQDKPSTSESQNENLTGSGQRERPSQPMATEQKVKELSSLIHDHSVIAVVGMGGVGKTFLTQLVFNRVKSRFDHSIWLTVSQTYSIQKLQETLAFEIDLIGIVEKRVDEMRAAQSILKRLRQTRSLIVLDDVPMACLDLINRLGLPIGDHDSQCKILITTRRRDVFEDMKPTIVYGLQPLSEEESWDLFCSFAFPDQHQNLPPPQLESIAAEIERGCRRLPLAVKTVAASLAGNTSPMEWRSKSEQLGTVSYTEDPVMEILLLCYLSLPPNLKLCFAFLSFFHEDAKIDPQYLINLWIAEELIPEGQNQQDIGWQYINHLQRLCLLETVDTDAQRNQSLKLHNLLLDLVMIISKKSKCAFSIEEALKNGRPEQKRSGYRNFRRLLLAAKRIDDRTIAQIGMGSFGSVKTLTLCNNDFSTISEQFFSSMKVLRILDLSSTRITTLPESVANLRLVRLLNLSRTEIKQVPTCVRKITNLRSLIISGCRRVTRLPEWIGELRNLEHLNVAGCSEELTSYMPAGISKLLSLRILVSDYLNLSIEGNKLLKLEHFASLTKLEELCLNVNFREELEAIEEGVLEQLVKMRFLAIANEIPPIQFENAADLPCLPDSMKAMENIEKLFLWNFDLPSSVSTFQKLRVLQINGDCIRYTELGTMRCLESLCLFQNHKCTALPPTFGSWLGFQKLRFLEISDFPYLCEISNFEDGAMPRLEKLSMKGCQNLKKVPDGLERLRGLKQIEFHGSTQASEALKEGGEYRNKIKSINPSVVIDLLQ